MDMPMTAQQAQALDRRRWGRWKMLAVLAVCASPVVASYVTYFWIRPEARTNYGQLIQPSVPVPVDLPLRKLSGEAVPAHRLKGQWLVVTVGSGACGHGCEQRLLLQRQLRETLGRERDRVDKVWLVTDEQPIAPALLEAVQANPAVTVWRVPEAALRAWLSPEAGHALDEHFYVVDPMGQWMMRMPVNPEPAKFKRDLERLLRASSSWDQAGR